VGGCRVVVLGWGLQYCSKMEKQIKPEEEEGMSLFLKKCEITAKGQ